MGWKFLEAIGDKVAAAAKGSDEEMAKALEEKVQRLKDADSTFRFRLPS